jgi:molecular chaperone GrpE
MNENNTQNEEFEDVTFVESTEDGGALPTKDVVKKLREDLKQARTEKEEYLTGWQRAKADYVNLQKELTEVRTSSVSLGKEKAIEAILPALDSFSMAMGNKDAWEKVDATWRTGVEYIYNQLLQGLADAGVASIGTVGEKFDPMLHEAIENIATDEESKDNTISSVIQKGYKIGERIIRPARVTVFECKK